MSSSRSRREATSCQRPSSTSSTSTAGAAFGCRLISAERTRQGRRPRGARSGGFSGVPLRSHCAQLRVGEGEALILVQVSAPLDAADHVLQLLAVIGERRRASSTTSCYGRRFAPTARTAASTSSSSGSVVGVRAMPQCRPSCFPRHLCERVAKAARHTMNGYKVVI